MRSALLVEGRGPFLLTFSLLLAWLVLFASQEWLTRLWRPWFSVYLLPQTVIVVVLVSQNDSSDFFAVLFGVLAMQLLEQYGLALGAVCLALFVPLTVLPLLRNYDGPEAATLTFIYTAVNVFLGAYAIATRRAAEARSRNEELGRRLRAANTELVDYSQRLERLAVAKERNRLARELHDSVTQTIFSMTLAGQSAALLLERQPSQVGSQLERLNELAQNALAEMHALVSQLAPDATVPGGLTAAIRRDLERRRADGLEVILETGGPVTGETGSASLSIAEEQGLLRIAQEALNNVAKHSGARRATVGLGLGGPPWMEIRDQGRGFDPTGERGGPGIGLASMSERAREIGWSLSVESSPGEGTVVRVRRLPLEEEGHDGG